MSTADRCSRVVGRAWRRRRRPAAHRRDVQQRLCRRSAATRISWNGESSRTNAFPSASTRSTRAGRLGADEQVAGLVEGERRRVRGLRLVEGRALAVRRDLVDDALLAGAGEDVAFRVDGERPDVLVVRVEERRRRAVAIDLVDLAVRRGADVQAAVGRRRQRVDLELGAVEEQRALALRRRSGRPCLRCRCRRRASRRPRRRIDQRNGAAVS